MNKIKQQGIYKTKELVADYLVLTHKESHNSYEGFTLTIEDNCFSNYIGKGYEKVKCLKAFLENQLLEIDLATLTIIHEI